MFVIVFYKIFMAIISGVMQMAGTGEQVEDIGDARSALSSLFGVSESVRLHHPFDSIRKATHMAKLCDGFE